MEEVRVLHRLRLVQGQEQKGRTAGSRDSKASRGREGDRGRQAGCVNLDRGEALYTVRATRVTTDHTVHGT